MIPAKNYETVFKFVKVMPRILVASFFPRHGVEDKFLSPSISPSIVDMLIAFGWTRIGLYMD